MQKNLSIILYLFVCLSLLGCDNDTKKQEPPIVKTTNRVSQFVYDGLSIYYLWADDMKSKTPKITDTEPQKYFKELLYSADTKHGWSWITNDIEGLIASFSGEPVSFGFNVFPIEIKGKYYATIKYVFKNTPASEQNLKRLDLIGEINGQPISNDTYKLLFSDKSVKLTIYKLQEKTLRKERVVNISPIKVKTNPVLLDTIYNAGNKKVGYLFYTGFISEFNSELYKAFEKFKTAQVTDLILDLRYNHGGSINAASYLTSMIAPASHVQNKSTLTTLSYNKFVNSLFSKRGWSRDDNLGDYQKGREENPIKANLDLSKVYIIATGDSFSASELATFCLRPYMDVVHIGSKTGGKYTASWTVHPYDKKLGNIVYNENKLSESDKSTLKNWGMQPIIAIYTDKDGKDFSDTDGLIPDVKIKEGFGYIDYWTKLGDTKDVLLGQALYMITGDTKYQPSTPTTRSHSPMLFINEDIKLSAPVEPQKESVIIDNRHLTLDKLMK